MSHNFDDNNGGLNQPLSLYSVKDEQIIVSAPTDITWNTPLFADGVTYTAPGLYTLNPGSTYILAATVIPSAGGSGTSYQWTDNADVPVGTLHLGQNNTEHVHVILGITPGVPIIVKLRLMSVPSSITIDANSTLTVQIVT